MACDPQTLVTNAVCQLCNLPPGTQLPIVISLLCQIRDNSANTQQLLNGAFANPNNNVTPLNPKNPALYYVTDVAIGSQSLWQWNTGGQNWTQLI